jgi:DNA-binding CsgD family transcriptional regulator
MIQFFDLSGTVVLLFAISVFPFFITGQKPGKWVKAVAASLAFLFLMNTCASFWKKGFIFPVINKAIIAAVFLSAFFIIISSLRDIGNATMRKAIGYLIALSVILIPPFLMGTAKEHFSLIHSFSLPTYLLITSFCGLLMIKTFFNVPFYINPENGKLSEFFLKKFNITEREEQIIMLLRKGRAYKEIAEELVIAYKTVDAHIQNIYSKTGVNRRKQLLNLIETSSI